MESYSGWGLSPATGQTKTVSLLLEYCWSETENWGYNYISSYLSFFNHPFTTDWGCTPSNIALLVYYAYNHIYINQYMVVSSNGGSQKPLVLILNCFNLGWLVPPWLRKPPYIHTYILYIYTFGKSPREALRMAPLPPPIATLKKPPPSRPPCPQAPRGRVGGWGCSRKSARNGSLSSKTRKMIGIS